MKPALVFLLLMVSAVAQIHDGAVNRNAVVRIFPTKRAFRAGERIRLPVALVNESDGGLYIAKRFTDASGGAAGFYYEIHQLTGKRPTEGCTTIGDAIGMPDFRSAEQVLNEDYIYLPPRAFVGFELSPLPCEFGGTGKYRIEVYYSAQDWNVSRVAALHDLKAPVLTGQTKKVALAIEILPPLEKRPRTQR